MQIFINLCKLINLYFGCSGVLVCTDVMGRGIDIPDVHWVIQYDPRSGARYLWNALWFKDTFENSFEQDGPLSQPMSRLVWT